MPTKTDSVDITYKKDLCNERITRFSTEIITGAWMDKDGKILREFARKIRSNSSMTDIVKLNPTFYRYPKYEFLHQ